MTSELPDPSRPSTGDDDHAVRSTTRLFLGQVLAVAAIATVLTGFGVLVKGDDTAGTRTAEATATPGTAGSAGSPGQSLPSTSQPGSSSPATPSESATTAPAPAPASTPAEDRPFVDVLNQSAGKGAAARVAADIEVTGWRIGRVDNFSGNVRTTTIYFFPGQRKHARVLEGSLAGKQRLLPAFDTLVEDRLSIILVEPIPRG